MESASSVAQGRASTSDEHWIVGAFDRLAEWTLYAIAILVPLTFLPDETNMFTLPKITALRLLTLLLLGAFLLRGISAGRFRLIRTPLDLPLAAYLVVGVLASVFSLSINNSIFGMYRRGDGLITMINLALLYYLAVNILDTEARLKRCLHIVALVGGFIGLITVGEFFRVPWLDLDFMRAGIGYLFGGRPYALSGNPDFLGNYLVMSIPIPVALFLLSKGRGGRIFWATATTLCSVGLFLTGTRAGWLSFAITLLVGLPLLWKYLLPRKFWFIGIAVIFVVVAVVEEMGWYLPIERAIFPGSIPSAAAPSETASDAAQAQAAQSQSSIDQAGGQVLNATIPPTTVGKGDLLDRVTELIETGGTGRLEIWQGSLGALGERPILGSGPGNFQTAFAKYSPLKWVRLRPTMWPDKAHNEFLDVAVQMGLLGLGAYLWFLFTFVRAVWASARREASEHKRILLICLLLAWLAYLGHSFFLFGMIDTWTTWWLTIGLTIALVLLPNRREVVWQIGLPALPRAVAAAVVIVVLALPVGVLVDAVTADRYLFIATDTFHGAAGANVSLDVLRKALELNSRDNAVLVEVGRDLIVTASMAPDQDMLRQDLEESVRVYSRAIQRDRLNPALYYERGLVYENFGYDHQMDALVDYSRATSMFPRFVFALERQIYVANKLGRMEDAIIAQRQMVNVFPHRLDVLLSLGSNYLSIGRVDEAMATWDRAMILDSSVPDLRYLRGLGFEAKHDFDKAREEFNTALEYKPDFAPAQAALADLANSQNQQGLDNAQDQHGLVHGQFQQGPDDGQNQQGLDNTQNQQREENKK